MKLLLKMPVLHNGRICIRGDEIEVSEESAKRLVSRGYAEVIAQQEPPVVSEPVKAPTRRRTTRKTVAK